MDQLAHNLLVKIIRGFEDEVYRVIFDDPVSGRVVMVRLTESSEDPALSRRGGRKRRLDLTLARRKKPPQAQRADPEWFRREELSALHAQKLLLPIEIELERPYFLSPVGQKSCAEYEMRKRVARPFLDFAHLKEEVLVSEGFGSLIAEAMFETGCSRSLAYKTLSLLCRYGFSERSLRDRRFACGAPGTARRCDPGGRRKAGRKTSAERMARLHGEESPSTQPGMSSEWVCRILAADRELKKLRMKMPERVIRIYASAFVQRYRWEDGKLVAVDLQSGQYPNRRQVRRVLETELPRIVQIRDKTTAGHFLRTMRGLRGKSWHQIPGPGHTWAIDSTIGDIYLRSTINRSWVIGRPVVYIVVDVWSTAVVGFHVCLEGPSWPMAQLALFNSVANPAQLAELFGYTAEISLNPQPTLPVSLWMDNGEYRSKAGRRFGVQILDEAFTPPYRPDWHGIVEVLHRIEKEHIQSIPGAIDYRRKELELRQYRPFESVMTLPEFTAYLHSVFTIYNLTADRSHRLDARMKACDVVGSPAGLWRFGHSVGIGSQRYVPQSELMMDMLPQGLARVTRTGIFHGGLQYDWPESRTEEWATLARNRGGWDIQTRYHPGAVAKIWTPDACASGLEALTLSDSASAPPQAPFFDYLDAQEYGRLKRPEAEHQRTLVRLEGLVKQSQLIDQAKALTKDADLLCAGAPRPTFTEARHMEITGAIDRHAAVPPTLPAEPENAALEDQLSLIARLLQRENARHTSD